MAPRRPSSPGSAAAVAAKPRGHAAGHHPAAKPHISARHEFCTTETVWTARMGARQACLREDGQTAGAIGVTGGLARRLAIPNSSWSRLSILGNAQLPRKALPRHRELREGRARLASRGPPHQLANPTLAALCDPLGVW